MASLPQPILPPCSSAYPNLGSRLVSGLNASVRLWQTCHTFFPSALRLLLSFLRLFGSDRQIFELWLACWTQQEIADEVGISATDKALRVSGKEYLKTKNQQAAADHATDFDPPIYNVWKQQTKSPLARACEMLR